MRKILVSLTAVMSVMLFVDDTATGQERCFAKYRFRWGQQVQGSIGARVGTACRVPINSRLGPITSAQVVQQPSSGAASIESSNGVVYRPNPGFRGSDSMTVLYRGAGTRQATVTFAISVN
jgi:hypothetical protein